jgi:hypothetical protein
LVGRRFGKKRKDLGHRIIGDRFFAILGTGFSWGGSRRTVLRLWELVGREEERREMQKRS